MSSEHVSDECPELNKEIEEILLVMQHLEQTGTFFLHPSVAKKILRTFRVPKTRCPVFNPGCQKNIVEPMPFEEWERDVLPTISAGVKTVIEHTQGLKEWIRATIFFVHSNPEILNEN